MDELLAEFLTETTESLGELDTALVQLEQNPGNRDLLSRIFRVMHTIKGTSGFLGLARLGGVAHKGEDLLGLFREGKLQPRPEYITLVLESIDRIKSILAELSRSGQEPAGDDSALIAKLDAACRDEAPAAKTPAVETEASPDASTSGDVATGVQSLRVNVDVLENLMTLVSELVLTRNQILQANRSSQKDGGMGSSLQRLNHIVSDLQEGVMKTRMQPVGNAWSKLPRIVRDIASDLGKKIDLEMLGQETELDRQVLDMIKDPLTHMVRNSADHGIEKPEDRRAAGKPETGKIHLNSYHEGGHIIIRISDDGRGLPLEKIRQKIVQNGLATEAAVAAMTPRQIQQYIFHAGFSTAEKVTAVSGRGVGMDVVRSNIEKIGGSIEMESSEGFGTDFIIKIPLTLAIVSALIIGVNNERFAIPQLDVGELVMVTSEGPNRIESINGSPLLRLRGKILPLICLRKLLGLPAAASEAARYVAVINAGNHSFGIIVDRVFDTEEIVVKPVTRLLNGQSLFSGNTILGDGQVIMILDTSGILRISGIAGNSAANNKIPETAAGPQEQEEAPLLLFLAGDNNFKAVPLQHVQRLEDVDLAKVELADGKRVIQYGDKLMPLYTLTPDATLPHEGKRPVIVFMNKGNLAGLMVDRIFDITAHRGAYQIKREGLLEGSAIINGRATDIINLHRDWSHDAAASLSPSAVPASLQGLFPPSEAYKTAPPASSAPKTKGAVA